MKDLLWRGMLLGSLSGLILLVFLGAISGQDLSWGVRLIISFICVCIGSLFESIVRRGRD